MAWLAFLICDEPDWIVKLIDQYPEFIPMYQHLYDMCRSTERMVYMFSEELKIMDRNTVRYMIDELVEQNEKLTSANEELVSAKGELISELDKKEALIRQLQEELKRLQQPNTLHD